jgi:hypothetical protein
MFLGSKLWPARNADNLTSICEPIVYTMLDRRHVTILQALQAFLFYFTCMQVLIVCLDAMPNRSLSPGAI